MGRNLLVMLVFSILCNSAQAGGLREIQKALESRDREERAKAVTKLSEMQGKVPLLLLIEAIADEDAVVRARARRGLSGRRSPADQEIIASRGTRHRSPLVRKACFAALAAERVENLEELLLRALKDTDSGVREAAVDLVITNLGGRGRPMLAAAVLRGKVGRPRAAALLALASIDPVQARRLAGGVLADRSFELRVAALEVIGDGPGNEAVPVLAAALDDPCWSVRLTAFTALAEIRRPEAVDALIASLGREQGRLREEQGEALARLTGMGLPPVKERWEEWREENSGELQFPEHQKPASEHTDASAATFHNIPFCSAGVAFVLDRSRSMRDRLKREAEQRKGELVEAELTRTLAGLSAPTKFLLVAFRTSPEAFTRKPVTATSCARQKALKWFRKLRPEGRTNLFDAVALALGSEEIDTIFLLTDGAPSAGQYQSRTQIVREIVRLNRYRKAAIHTVEIGGEATGKRWRGFLAELARANGGKHIRR